MKWGYEMLQIKDLSIAYNSVVIVSDVNLEIKEGTVVSLIGPNGAGKSSILKSISGLVRPVKGEVLYQGRNIVGMLPHEIAELGIGHVMEGRHLFSTLSVEDNLLLASINKRHESVGVHVVYKRWPILQERKNQLAGSLSGGEQQLLAIGRALMGSPKLLILDEPSWGLAPQMVRNLMNTILRFRDEGMTIFLVEQMANIALNVCDYGYVMVNGRITLEGEQSKLRSDPDVIKSYLGKKADTFTVNNLSTMYGGSMNHKDKLRADSKITGDKRLEYNTSLNTGNIDRSEFYKIKEQERVIKQNSFHAVEPTERKDRNSTAEISNPPANKTKKSINDSKIDIQINKKSVIGSAAAENMPGLSKYDWPERERQRIYKHQLWMSERGNALLNNQSAEKSSSLLINDYKQFEKQRIEKQKAWNVQPSIKTSYNGRDMSERKTKEYLRKQGQAYWKKQNEEKKF
jgi:branched-chain amino acid transport system ATP-binding protein